jgi:hypothetical protein
MLVQRVIQKGIIKVLQVYGTNSLSRDMQIRQTGTELQL